MEDIDKPDFTYSRIKEIDILHFTGGIRGRRVEGGWGIGPMGPNGALGSLAPVSEGDVGAAASALGIKVFGADEELLCDPYLRTRIWRPFVGLPHYLGLPTETWASIGHHALEASDELYANLARNVAECLRASDVRLRDLSDEYESQLLSALHSQTEAGVRFDNLPLKDLFLAIHSLVAEMGAARDYLASIVGLHLGAPAKCDSLARLKAWLDADARQVERVAPMAAALLEGVSGESGDPWLNRLTAYRNLFLHRGPMGTSGIEDGPHLVEFIGAYGLIRTFRVPLPRNVAVEVERDALEEFADLHRALFHLASHLASMARYATTPQAVTFADLAD
ncbi:hypothetical protein [Brevundimonas sp.]